MKKYKEYQHLDFNKTNKSILDFWETNKIFERSIENRKNGPNFVFYDGPPSASGMPGIHHVLSRTLKDIFCRYRTLKGYKVKRTAGWDTHGLPIELKVEKTLGITKEDIGNKISLEDYNKECKKTVMLFKKEWDDLTKKMGYWVDLDNPYITFDNSYIESVWFLLKKLFDKNLLYEGYTIQPYSPAAGTGLSSHELNMPGCYKEVKDTSITAQFKLKNAHNEYFLAWTTTPWTLPANSALAVGKNIEYAKIHTINPYTKNEIKVILAKDCIAKYFDEKYNIRGEETLPGTENTYWKLIDSFLGKDIIGSSYEQLLPYVKPTGDAFRVIEGDFISTDDGTGIVHIAPTFGADDMRVAQKGNISSILVKDRLGNLVPIVDKKGKFVSEIKDFAGEYVKKEYEDEKKVQDPDYLSVDVKIAIKLKKENKAFKVEKYEHNYPHCWRTDKPILYYPLDSWFIKTTEYKQRLIDSNKEINWIPKHVGSGRFGNWLENLVDWNLSRDRFWGIPLPIWKTESEKSSEIEQKCIGSVEELRQEIDKSIKMGYMKNQISKDFDLHRPFIDDIILVSEKGQKMYRVTDVIDVWFDSGAMPYANLHYPFENKKEFFDNFPADFIAEGIDQTRGWFFTLHTIAIMLFDSIAFKNVVVNGLVLDKQGNKMSKRLNNTIDPFEMIEKYGIDVIRWYMATNSNPWENLKFDEEELTKIHRKFFNTLENIYNFFALYANIDNFDASKNIAISFVDESDKWITSKLHSLIKNVNKHYDEYDVLKAGRAIQNFVVDDLSNWYVRLNRERFWKSVRENSSHKSNDNKLAAYYTLYKCLEITAILSSPIIPFYSEKLFKDLNIEAENKLSIHLIDFPIPDEMQIDEQLEARMSLAQSITSLAHSLRKKHKIKVRQPLQKILIPLKNEIDKIEIEKVKDLILTEINVKTLEIIDANQQIVKKKIKPDFKKLGKIYGNKMKEVTDLILKMSQKEIFDIEENGKIKLGLDKNSFEISYEDVIVTSEDIPGLAVASDSKNTIALDITLTDELISEGLARELVNRIQNLRKELGFNVQDRINIQLKIDNETLRRAILTHMTYIKKETLANELRFVDNIKDSISINIENEEIKIKIWISTNLQIRQKRP